MSCRRSARSASLCHVRQVEPAGPGPAAAGPGWPGAPCVARLMASAVRGRAGGGAGPGARPGGSGGGRGHGGPGGGAVRAWRGGHGPAMAAEGRGGGGGPGPRPRSSPRAPACPGGEAEPLRWPGGGIGIGTPGPRPAGQRAGEEVAPTTPPLPAAG